MSDNIIQLNEVLIKQVLKDLARSSVEETLNALLDKEDDELVDAQKYEHSVDRLEYCLSHYKRNFQTFAGDVALKVPKLKGILFKTAFIGRYRRRESRLLSRWLQCIQLLLCLADRLGKKPLLLRHQFRIAGDQL